MTAPERRWTIELDASGSLVNENYAATEPPESVEVCPVSELQRANERVVELEDGLTALRPDECAVVLTWAEADALLAMMEQANNSGITPGIGLRVETAQDACFKLVGERFRDQDPYNRAPRIRAVARSRLSSAKTTGSEHG